MSGFRPLKILYISNHRRFKIHFRAYPWARGMAARGHDVDVMCHADTERWRTRIEMIDGFRLIENPDLLVGPLRQGWDPVCALRRRNMLFREDKPYDIVHCLDTRLAVILPAITYSRAKGLVIVSDWIDWWGRGGLIQERRPWWYQFLFAGIETFFEESFRNKLDGLTTISHALIDRAVALGVPPNRCKHIPGGADLANFPFPLSREESRRALTMNEDAPVLCFSGLDVLIDLPMAVRAFEYVLDKIPRARLLLVGPTKEQARTMVSTLRSLDAIHATGPIPYAELAGYLAAADVFLAPYANKISNIGRWPNKIGDYMCMGRPTVSNPVGEIKWLFEKYPIGLLAEEQPAAMADAAFTLLNNPSLAAQMGHEARHVAETVFQWDILLADLENWYHYIIKEAAHKHFSCPRA